MVDLEISRIQPLELQLSFARKFPNVQALDLSYVAVPPSIPITIDVLKNLLSLEELSVTDLAIFNAHHQEGTERVSSAFYFGPCVEAKL